MNINISNNIARYCVIVLFTIMTLVIPIVLFYIGSKPSGVDLKNAIPEPRFTLENYQMLLFEDTPVAEAYRGSILNSIIYSAFVGFFATLLAIISNIWISGYSQKTAIGITFILLSLILLPQTYLVLAGMKILNQITFFQNEVLRIIFFLFISVIPVSIWFFYFISGSKIRRLLSLIALDSMKETKTVWVILKNTKIDIIIVFLFTFAFVWGNFLIPFSFGSTKSFTSPVLISSFTTNLGRDWALISTSGIISILPPVIFIIVIISLNGLHKNRKYGQN
ncbi:MAG: hypothetical protein K8R68_11585 [Bacteroidales bacterium]|nr:hypothetical protein [Bacteroidales bacterium]